MLTPHQELGLHLAFLSRLATSGWSVGPLSLLVGAALVTVGWFDYASTRREFDTLVRAQAASARDTVAAAARANRAAAVEAREQLAERLLDNARLIAEVDRRGGLTEAALENIAATNHIFRITIIGPDGSRERSVAPQWPGRGAGPGGGYGAGGYGPGGGFGAGMPGGALIDRLIQGEVTEAVTDLHEGRRGGVSRLAAGVRRANGGAIVLSVDATAVANLQKQSSLDALLADIVRSTEDVAYIVFDDGAVRRSQGVKEEGRAVLEIAGPIDIGGPTDAHLTLGMRLDRLRSAERRTLVRLVISLASAAALGVLAIGFAWIRQRFGELSARHALAQEALRRRDRLSAMGELASTVAHEIRNPLNAIAMSAQRLKKECLDVASGGNADADDAGTLVDVIQAETQRLNAKVQQFLEYARPPALDRRAVELSPWVAGIVNAVRPLAESRGITLDVELDDGSALLDPEQLRQALDNLLLNAIEATPEGGGVSVRTMVSPGEWTIEVRDTGTGIDPADLPRIFDLYFTTKTTGTGVGLAVTQQIVAGHGGTIEVDSTPSQGTVMRIRVPAAGEPAHG